MTAGPAAPTQLFNGTRFVVSIPDIVLGEFVECTGLSLEVEVTPYAEGGNHEFVHQLPGRVKYPPLVLKRGITKDDALLKWVVATRTHPQPKDLTITLVASDGVMLRAWAFDAAFPVKWTGPVHNPGSGELATESLEIVHQGMRPT